MTVPAAHDPYARYRGTLLSPERVRALSRLRPGVAVRDATVAWACIIGAWTVAAHVTTWPVVLLAAFVVGNRYYALFIIGHDGLHRRIFPSLRANDLFNDLVVLGPLGAITRLNNRNHLAHHRHLGSESDPDRHRHACVNKADRLAVVGFLTGLSSASRAVYQVFVAPRRNPSRSHGTRAAADRYTVRDVAILVGWQVVLLGGLTATFGWWGYLVLWGAPVFLFTFLADNFRSFVEHSHPEADGQADRHRLVTFESNWFERMLVAPMNMNLHAAHHLWVSIPYYQLPQADAEMQRHPLGAELERRGSYLGYLVRYWRALPLEECRRAPAARA